MTYYLYGNEFVTAQGQNNSWSKYYHKQKFYITYHRISAGPKKYVPFSYNFLLAYFIATDPNGYRL